MNRLLSILLIAICGACATAQVDPTKSTSPDIIWILAEDISNELACYGEPGLQTPNVDALASEGVRYERAYCTGPACSTSRSAMMAGVYQTRIDAHDHRRVGSLTFPTITQYLRDAGYFTAKGCGFSAKTDLNFKPATRLFDGQDWSEAKKQQPIFAQITLACTHRKDTKGKTWNAVRQKSNDPVQLGAVRLPPYFPDTKAIRHDWAVYLDQIELMDSQVGEIVARLKEEGRYHNAMIIFCGDNGRCHLRAKNWLYEPGLKVPLIIKWPGGNQAGEVVSGMVSMLDVSATVVELAGATPTMKLDGQSLASGATRDLIFGARDAGGEIKDHLRSVCDGRWKYIRNYVPALGYTESKYTREHRPMRDEMLRLRAEGKLTSVQSLVLANEKPAEELYDLQVDPHEIRNLAANSVYAQDKHRLAEKLDAWIKLTSDTGLKELKKQQRAATSPSKQIARQQNPATQIPADPPQPPRTDLFISGVYPHLTTYGIYSQNGAHTKKGHNECGIGAIVPWAGRLWMVNYAPHMPKGSEHKLYSIGLDLSQQLKIHPESVGGTPAGRMIHAESQQLLIGHHLIDSKGNVRTIQPADMPIRVTAIARHLNDPANKVYYVDMEGSIWEANVHTLEVKRLFKKPVPGWHSKGGYTSQGRLVVSNNGELHVGNYDDVLVGGEATNDEERGVLAEWNGSQWRIVERRQYTEVTGPPGIAGGSDGDDPIWSMGWDRRSLRFKLLEDRQWHTYLLPKAAYCNDASHGWYTEWPRIREITDGRWMMDMHGMFFDFPKTFSVANSHGLRPIGSHLRYVPDFCGWNDRLVLATDETSIQGNHLAGQPQSNLWFGRYEDLKTWGPANGYGGPWIDDRVSAEEWSDPFLVAGFQHRCLHLAVGPTEPMVETALRTTDQQQITVPPEQIADRDGEPVTFQAQIDINGTNQWSDFRSFTVNANEAKSIVLPSNLDAVWIRFRTNRDCVATAMLHQTSEYPNTISNTALFAGLADVGDRRALGARVYAAKRNRNLRIVTSEDRCYEFTKDRFEFQADASDESISKLLRVEPEFTIDEASVIIESQGQRYRLPKGDSAYDEPFASGWPRALREVESERTIANVHGTFYEVPLITNGAPPAWNLIRPISSHRKQITDYCSWNGLLVLSGVRHDAPADGHVFRDPKLAMGLWFGAVDDLWKFGQPVGNGGPWKNTSVRAGVPSDAYLMTGFDQKSVSLSHTSTEPVTIRLQIDLDGRGRWIEYKSFNCPAAKVLSHAFPDGFSACWIRAVSDRATTATVQLNYQ